MENNSLGGLKGPVQCFTESLKIAINGTVHVATLNVGPHSKATLPASPTKNLNKIHTTTVFRNWVTESTELLYLREKNQMR